MPAVATPSGWSADRRLRDLASRRVTRLVGRFDALGEPIDDVRGEVREVQRDVQDVVRIAGEAAGELLHVVRTELRDAVSDDVDQLVRIGPEAAHHLLELALVDASFLREPPLDRLGARDAGGDLLLQHAGGAPHHL